jgi:quercetin dioxygenase-like cupin family protein
MATAGARFRMPDGSVYIVRSPAADTDGGSVEMEFVLPSRCIPPPPHIHPQQVEEYEVLEGHFDVVVEGEWRTFAPGEPASVPIGALHTFRNRSGDEVRCDTLRAAVVNRRRDPRVFLYLSMVMLDFDDTLVPGRARERIPMRALALLARLLPAPTR